MQKKVDFSLQMRCIAFLLIKGDFFRKTILFSITYVSIMSKLILTIMQTKVCFNPQRDKEEEVMTKEDGLLEFLAQQVGVNYISDLRNNMYHKDIVSCIENVDGTTYFVREWLDVLDYLTGTTKKIQSPEEGKKALLEAL